MYLFAEMKNFDDANNAVCCFDFLCNVFPEGQFRIHYYAQVFFFNGMSNFLSAYLVSMAIHDILSKYRNFGRKYCKY